ncbi:hypothetical protein T552_00863 [Pneumocystis carinii B80]|uniref:SCD domain-containing protein n=1 Tax=Pneumocystis carinii (strain B80) TaxID=1408658 RepID=A0A0W4ZMQ0_PNEC8|nr:hypothetical protein T552_00863 [Pneumocystis carinii B80]KTW29655.1 hypothetical protein T552_00863 [Pneumocystis carinii B80]
MVKMYNEEVRRSRRTRQQRKMFSGLETGEILEDISGSELESNEGEVLIEDEYTESEEVERHSNGRVNKRIKERTKNSRKMRDEIEGVKLKRVLRLEERQEEGNSLFEALIDYEASLEALVLDWIDTYERDAQQGLVELINCILKCCGCGQMINIDHLADQDSVTDTLYEIQEASRVNLMRDYPIISKSNMYKGFKKRLIDFVHRWIDQVSLREHLYNSPELMEQIQAWVIAMSSSTFRSFRHTSTLISLAMVTSLSGVLNRVTKEEQIANKQYETEKKRRSNEERMKIVKTRISTFGKQIEFLKTTINDFFDSVFVHRYRDIDPKIRCDCVHELGLWMIKLPSIFFDGIYLRYLGWVLSDISPLTRLEVVKTLSKLYSNNEFIAGLRHFTERFKPRLIEMALHEVDSNIRCSSITLLNGVRLCGFLEDDEIDLICTLLFDTDSRIRKRVSPFFLAKVEELFENKIQELGDPTLKCKIGTENGDSELNKPLWIKYKVIAELLIQLDETADDVNSSNKENIFVKDFNNTDYLDIASDLKPQNRIHMVSMAICSDIEELKNWESLAEYLLHDHVAVSSKLDSSKEPKHRFYQICAPTEKEENVLLQVLYVCVYLDIFSPDYDIKSKKKLFSQIKDEHEESVSRILLGLVPSLLKKFNFSADASVSILRLEQLIKLSVYQNFRQNKTYENLLDLIGKQFMKHPNNLVMKEAISSLLKAQQFDEFSSITQEKIVEIQEEAVNQLKNIKSNRDLKTAHLSTKMIENLTIAIKRLDYISSISDCIKVFETDSFKVSLTLLELVERIISFDDSELEMIISSLRTLKWLYLWKVKHLIDHKDNISSKELNAIIADRDKLFDKFYPIIENKKYYRIGYYAVSFLIDLYVIFFNLKTINTKQIFDETIFIIPEKMQNIIILLLNHYIKQYTKVNDSRGVKFLIDEETDHELEDNSDEKTPLVLEKFMCEITGKVVLAILNGAMSNKYIPYLIGNRDKLGLSYNHIVSELDILETNEKNTEKN